MIQNSIFQNCTDIIILLNQAIEITVEQKKVLLEDLNSNLMDDLVVKKGKILTLLNETENTFEIKHSQDKNSFSKEEIIVLKERISNIINLREMLLRLEHDNLLISKRNISKNKVIVKPNTIKAINAYKKFKKDEV